MPSILNLRPSAQQDFVDRLKRMEGQARGIQRMIEEGRDCRQVLHQVTALKAAAHSLSAEMLEQFALYCLAQPDDFESPDKAIAEMVAAVMRAGK